jgi:hypothetical protein
MLVVVASVVIVRFFVKSVLENASTLVARTGRHYDSFIWVNKGHSESTRAAKRTRNGI